MLDAPSRKLFTLRFDSETVDTQGWQLPSVIYVSGSLWYKGDRDIIEVRPLTITALARGIGGNFVVMNYWRFLRCLRIYGVLSTPEGGSLRWRHATPFFWRYWMPGRTWWGRTFNRIKRRLS